MSAMPERWTDREIDGLSRKVDGLGDRMDQRFEQVDQRFEQVDQRFEQVEHRFDRVEAMVHASRAETKDGLARSNAELLDMRKELHAGLESIRRTMFSAAVAIVVALITAPHL